MRGWKEEEEDKAKSARICFFADANSAKLEGRKN